MNEALSRMLAVSTRVRIPLTYSEHRVDMWAELATRCGQDPDAFLDVVDATLFLLSGQGADSLRFILESGGSVWTVAENGEALERRVDSTAKEAADVAMRPNDAASEELRQSWGAVYGRNPDPSDAWDHAIKAVEAMLTPLVTPKQDKPTLGHVIGALRGNPKKWIIGLPGPSQSYETAPLLATLDLLWPNPDRHGNANRRKPSQEEAQSAVYLAVTIVQWARDKAIRPR